MKIDEVNAATASLVHLVGRELGKLPYPQVMVTLEGLTTGMLLMIVQLHNKQPDELVEAFSKGIQTRMEKIIYGEKQ